MFRLKRKKGESITIRTESGEEVKMRVYKLGRWTDTESTYAWLEFDAPKSIRILRSEIDGGKANG
jgi:sRNA-binding carbon storage regulator CsrA